MFNQGHIGRVLFLVLPVDQKEKRKEVGLTDGPGASVMVVHSQKGGLRQVQRPKRGDRVKQKKRYPFQKEVHRVVERVRFQIELDCLLQIMKQFSMHLQELLNVGKNDLCLHHIKHPLFRDAFQKDLSRLFRLNH